MLADLVIEQTEELSSMREERELLDRFTQLHLSKLTEDRGDLWAAAVAAFRDLLPAIGGIEERFSLNKLEAILENGLGQEKAEKEVRRLIQESNAVAKTEIQRATAQSGFIAAKEAQVLVLGALQIVLKVIESYVPESDRDRVRTIAQADFVRVTSGSVRHGAESRN